MARRRREAPAQLQEPTPTPTDDERTKAVRYLARWSATRSGLEDRAYEIRTFVADRLADPTDEVGVLRQLDELFALPLELKAADAAIKRYAAIAYPEMVPEPSPNDGESPT